MKNTYKKHYMRNIVYKTLYEEYNIEITYEEYSIEITYEEYI